MHVHLPKPLHGWRAFAGEVGIIVVGVLIALSAEQFVEAWHLRSQAAEARGALRTEIGDNLAQAYTRLAVAPCLKSRLNQLDSAFAGHMDRAKFAALAQTYKPPNRSWDDEAWKAVAATGALSHGGASELIRWSAPYRVIVRMGPLNQTEADDAMELSGLGSSGGALTSAEVDRTTVELHRLRSREQRMEITSRVLFEDAREAGVVMTEREQQHVLADLRSDWGECVAAPRIAQLDLSSQSDLPIREAISK